MLVGNTQTAPVKAEKHHITFFRQSGWMMTAGLANGLLMWMVHPIVTRKFPTSEYGVFTTLLMVTTMMTTPAGGLQPVIAQQQAAAITEEKQRIVASEFRGILKALFVVWLLMVAVAAVFWKPAVTGLKIQNPMALAITIVIGLAAMWMPLTQGILQGRQNFFWLGWMNIFNAVGRVGMICVLVLVFHAWAAGAMTAVLAGMCLVIVIGLWQVRDVWKVESAPVQWKNWLSRVIPLTLGLGAANFMIGTDMIFTQKYFPASQTGYYAVAATIGRALIFLTQPLTIVMFPKLARAKAAGEKSNALALTLGTTLLAGGCAAIGCTILPSLPLLIMGGKKYLVAAPLVPWYSWCMLPLAISQVMVSSLMAHSRFSAVPWLIIVAVGYGFALSSVGAHYGNAADTFSGFRHMIQTIGVFNVLMFGVCALFTWGIKGRNQAD
jgi:O-antigen/teichoic acid export membrane protein